MRKVVLLAGCTIFMSACSNNAGEGSAPSTAEKKALLQQYQTQVTQFPDSSGIRLRYVNAMDSLGMYKEAIAETDSLIKRDSLNNGLWFGRARLQESDQDTAGAILSYEKAIKIYPSVEAQLSLANLFAEKRDPKALAICQNVARMGLDRETDAHCNFIAGIYYARTGNAKKATELFDQCINDNYTYMEAYMEKGFLLFEAKDFKGAGAIFDKAITVNNTYADAYYWLARCNEAAGDKQNAILNYQRALGLDKSIKEAKLALDKLQ